MEEAAKEVGNRNNEKGRNLRELHGGDPMGRTTRRKSSTCLETTNSDSASRRFGSEESEVGRCVRNRKSSAESVVGMRNPEVGSRIRNDKGEDRRMTAQEVLVQSESANNSSEEKSKIIGKARKFEMPIPPLRVDVPSSSARFQLLRGYRGMTRSFRPKSQSDRRVKGEKLGESGTRQQERSGCQSVTGLVVDSSMRGSEGPEASDEVPEEPKDLTNQSREATARTEANARMFGRVPMARAAEAEHDRKESPNGEMEEAEKAMKPKLQGVPNGTRSRWKISERKDEPEGAEQFPAKGCRPELKCTEPEAQPRSGMAGQDSGTRWQNFSDRIPTENIGCGWPKAMRNLKLQQCSGDLWNRAPRARTGKGTANGGVQPRTIPDASEDPRGPRSRDPKWKWGGNEPQTKMPKRQFGDAEGRSRGYPKCRDGKMSGWRVPALNVKMNECRRGMDVGDRKQLGGTDQEVGRDSEAIQQETSDQIPTENITEDIGSAECMKSAQKLSPKQDREFREDFAERAREMATENTGGADRKPGGGPNEAPKAGWNRRRHRRRGDRRPEDADKMSGGGTVRKQGPKGRTELRSDAARTHNTREMSGTEGTETECSEGNFAKSCEGNRRGAPKIAGGANRGLEGSTKRDSRLNGASEMQGRKVTEIRESRRKVGRTEKGSGLLIEEPGPGEDVWDFGKDVRDPERPESFSGASLGNRKSQNTIRTGVRDTESKPSANGKDRGRAEATGSTGRFGSKPKGEGEEGVEVEDEPNESGRARWSGTNSRSRKVEGRNREIPGIRCPKSRKRPRWKRGSAETSETCSRYRKASPDEGPSTTREDNSTSDTEIKGVRLSSLRLREEWKGGKEVVNDPDRSRGRGRAEVRRRPEMSRVDGEVTRADRSTEGQRPEVVRTEDGGRTGGKPEVIGTESK
ncbi:hypothetical protein DFH06DRAFT_1151364 [Mycena polygramma]|nr:hypothetical protein DFH06DRAFT_1151364 [Mycena polygramma]